MVRMRRVGNGPESSLSIHLIPVGSGSDVTGSGSDVTGSGSNGPAACMRSRAGTCVCARALIVWGVFISRLRT